MPGRSQGPQRQLLTPNIFQSWTCRWCGAGFAANPLPGHCCVQDLTQNQSASKIPAEGGSCSHA